MMKYISGPVNERNSSLLNVYNKDLFALIRQLSIPTLFASFSSADLSWPEMINTIIKQERKQINIDEIDWFEKCGLIRRNPVTAVDVLSQMALFSQRCNHVSS